MPKEFIIKPQSPFSFGLKELWQYRELVYLFAWREIKIKYKQAFLGFLWIILQPLLMMLLLSFFLSDVVNIKNSSLPYFLYVFLGLTVWNLFSGSVNLSVNQIISNANIIKKIYFPRLILPTSSIIVAGFDFIVSLSILLIMIILTDYTLFQHFNFIYFILSILLTILFALSLSLLLSALVIKYRDLRYVLPFLIQIFFFASPVIYDIQNKIPAKYQWVTYLNPLNLSIDLFRQSFEKQKNFNLPYFIYQIIFLLIFLLISIYIFRKTEEYIADVI